MIFVVEVPLSGEPRAWFAFDGEDLLSKVALEDLLQDYEIHDIASPRELLAWVGANPESSATRAEFPGIWALADEYGLDTPLYRADYALERGCFRQEPVSVERACEAALHARVAGRAGVDAEAESTLKLVRIFWSEPEAVLATESKDDPLFTGPGGWRALHALREQLLALDVLAES